MRELNMHEVESVSGGWLFSDIGSGIGYMVGSVIDKGASAGNMKTTAQSYLKKIGSGIGKIFELDLSGAVNTIGQGVGEMLQNSVSVISAMKTS